MFNNLQYPKHHNRATTLMEGALLGAFIIISGITIESAGQPGPRSGSNAHAFDFWIGDWTIRQQLLRQDGTWLELPAHPSVSATLDGYALIEHWRGQVLFFWEGMEEPESMEGLSVRAYDPEIDKWYIHWMDTRTPRFGSPYAGNFVDGRGEFFREWETPEGRRIGCITFSDITANSVNWSLAVSRDGGQTWQTIRKRRIQRTSTKND